MSLQVSAPPDNESCPVEFHAGRLIPEPVVKRWLKMCGKGVKVYAGARVFPPGRVSIGDYSQIDEGVWIYAGQGVTIGRHVHLAIRCSITGGGECVVNDFAGLGAGVRLLTGTEVVSDGMLANPTVPPQWRRANRGRITIGAHAIVFTSSIVFPDVTVGEGAVVAAGSLVHHDLKPWAVYAGNPLVQVGVRPSAPVLDAVRRVLEEERHPPTP